VERGLATTDLCFTTTQHHHRFGPQ